MSGTIASTVGNALWHSNTLLMRGSIASTVGNALWHSNTDKIHKIHTIPLVNGVTIQTM